MQREETSVFRKDHQLCDRDASLAIFIVTTIYRN